MKKFNLLLMFVVLLGLPVMVNASSGTISVSSSSQAIVGNTLTVTVKLASSSSLGSWEMDLSYNSSYLKLTSSTAESGGTHMVGYASSSSVYSTTYTFKFTVLKSGSSTLSVSSYLVYDYNESEMSISSSTKTVKFMTQEELLATYSSDNNLKSLSVEGYMLSPEFSSDTLDYSVSVPADVASITINAEENDSTATVSGTGEFTVDEGSNSFEIVVQAQNGDTKTYKVNVIVEDANPINISIDGESYTIIKRKDALSVSGSYSETTITINDIEVPAFYSEITNITLIGIKDSDGNILYAVYDDGNYSLYNETTSDQLLLYIKDIPSVLDGFTKSKVTISDADYECLKFDEIIIVYALNILTGDGDYYLYDTENNSFVIYDDAMVESLKSEILEYKNVILYMGGGIIFLVIIVFLLIIKKSRRPKMPKMPKEEVKIEEVKAKDKKEEVQEEKKEEKKASKSAKTKEKAIEEVNNATEIIENYEKTIKLSQKELAKKKEELEESEESEVTMYDIFEDDKKKKKKKKNAK